MVAGIALYKESDDLPDSSPYPWLSLFPVIETDGTLVFRWATEASIQGLVRAYESGLLPGDPRRPYLWPMIPQGGEVWFGSWPDLLEALKVFKDVAETMAAAYGSVQAVQALWGRLRGIDELDADQFEQHNAGPSQLDSILKPGRLSVPDLQAYFGLSDAQATALALAFGFDISNEETMFPAPRRTESSSDG